MVINDISRSDIGFDAAENEVVIVTPSEERRVPRAAKELVADAVLDAVDRIWSREREEGSDGSTPADTSSGARV